MAAAVPDPPAADAEEDCMGAEEDAAGADVPDPDAAVEDALDPQAAVPRARPPAIAVTARRRYFTVCSLSDFGVSDLRCAGPSGDGHHG
jgi:hypothetical protein